MGSVMKLDVRAAALSAGGIAVLAYAICAAACLVVPEPAVVFVTTGLAHVDISGLIRQFTAGTLAVGLVGWGLGAAAAAGATAWLYNRLARTGVEKS